MAHYVKCFYCGGKFDRDTVPFIKVSERRYAHVKCVQTEDSNGSISQEQKDKDAFYEMVKSIYGVQYNYMLINTQATEFIQQYGYTWSGMTKCLYWFYKINHGSLEEGHGGIGIIPYIYDDVKKYYYNLYITEQKNKEIKKLREPIIFNIQSPRAWHRPPQLLNIDEEVDK